MFYYFPISAPLVFVMQSVSVIKLTALVMDMILHNQMSQQQKTEHYRY